EEGSVGGRGVDRAALDHEQVGVGELGDAARGIAHHRGVEAP
ncbi:hypothetical protein LCGC14_2068240, partial [marine sediment metagenome]